ncbi:hypothetical protein LIER_21075 [Lithospermum erythrorhizon]|uniref:Uncharacterized protein n=1 Tax=Lithospermum erythrorhizon TaxID=34254 RepID=A0AAV3QS08_LITER
MNKSRGGAVNCFGYQGEDNHDTPLDQVENVVSFVGFEESTGNNLVILSTASECDSFDYWIIDSDLSVHVCGDTIMFHSIIDKSQPVIPEVSYEPHMSEILSDDDEFVDDTSNNNTSNVPRTTTRIRKPSSWLNDYVVSSITSSPDTNIFSIYIDTHMSFVSNLSKIQESYLISKHVQILTWELVQLPSGKKPIDCRSMIQILLRRLVGRLLYFNFIRPDLTHDVHHLSEFMQKLTVNHWNATLHIVKYLKGTAHHGMFYSSTSSLQLHAFYDADWAR